MKKLMTALVIALFVAACASTGENQKTKKGTAIGAVAGGAVGAVIGNQSGNPRTGAVVGAAVGAGVGAAVGHMMDKQQQELEQVKGVEVSRESEGELNVVMKNDILFDFDSSALRSTSRSTLTDVADVLVKYPDTDILVEGYTDSTGSDSYNQALSVRRARSVRDYLVTEGVAGSRLSALGYGESDPRASNDTAEGRQLNRRVEIHIRAIPQG